MYIKSGHRAKILLLISISISPSSKFQDLHRGVTLVESERQSARKFWFRDNESHYPFLLMVLL
jgi:hypothetical protein